MASPKQTPAVAVETSQDESKGEQRMKLRGGRELRVTADEAADLVEISAASGEIELRLVITDEGPVLKLDGVRLAIRAAESVDVQCKTFTVSASESVEVSSEGQLDIKSEKELRVTSPDDVRVRGRFIYLN